MCLILKAREEDMYFKSQVIFVRNWVKIFTLLQKLSFAKNKIFSYHKAYVGEKKDLVSTETHKSGHSPCRCNRFVGFLF